MEDSIAKSLLGHLNHRIKIKRLTTWRVVGNVEKCAASDTVGVVVVETGGTCRPPVMADGDHFVDLFGVDDVDEILCHCVPPVLGWISRLIGTIIAEHIWYDDGKFGINETFRDTLPHFGVIGPAMLKQQGRKRSVAFRRVVGVDVTREVLQVFFLKASILDFFVIGAVNGNFLRQRCVMMSKARNNLRMT
jgi:hypothetical protein